MPKVTILPHPQVAKDGAEFECKPGDNILEVALQLGYKIEHACELSCACTTCHVLVRDGGASFEQASDKEEDMLDNAWGLELTSRLCCQLIATDKDVVLEFPKYTRNLVSESH